MSVLVILAVLMAIVAIADGYKDEDLSEYKKKEENEVHYYNGPEYYDDDEDSSSYEEDFFILDHWF